MTPLRFCGASLLAACALVVAGCGGGTASGVGATGDPISFQELAQSASTSADATSGRFSFDVSMSFAGSNDAFALSGEGAFDAKEERASFAVDMSSLAKLLGGLVVGFGGSAGSADLPDFDDPEGWKIEVVQDGDVGYVRFPAIDDQLPEGKTWVRSAAGDMKAGSFDFEGLVSSAQSDPRDVLEALRGLSGDIETVGREELRGVETTHYRALLDSAELVKEATTRKSEAASVFGQLSQTGVAEVPLDIWIDGNGLVRKLALDVDVPEATSGQGGSVSLAFELWDYGERVEIDVPPAAQVADASAIGD